MNMEAFKQQMAALLQDYRNSLPPRFAEVDARWALIMAGTAGPDTFQVLLRELHTLAGSAKTFGLAELGQAARAAELHLEPFCAAAAMPLAGDRETFVRLLAELRLSAGLPDAAPGGQGYADS
jgi:HPt (histidine-containing phosphotransfer) domain-containing protein